MSMNLLIIQQVWLLRQLTDGLAMLGVGQGTPRGERLPSFESRMQTCHCMNCLNKRAW